MYRPQGGCRKGLSLCQLSQMQVQPGFSPRYAVSICGSETTLVKSRLFAGGQDSYFRDASPWCSKAVSLSQLGRSG